MKSIKSTTLKKEPFKLSEWIDTSSTSALNNFNDSLQESNRKIRRNIKGIWNKRLELLCGFIPALLVFVITYGKKFKQ